MVLGWIALRGAHGGTRMAVDSLCQTFRKCGKEIWVEDRESKTVSKLAKLLSDGDVRVYAGITEKQNGEAGGRRPKG